MPRSSQMEPEKTGVKPAGTGIFVDRLTVWSALWLSVFRRRACRVSYFQAGGKRALRLVRFFKKIGFIRFDAEKTTFGMADLPLIDGVSPYVLIRADADTIIRDIKARKIDGDPLIDNLGRLWDRDVLIHHFTCRVEMIVRIECLRLGLLSLHPDLAHSGAPELFIARNPYHPWLKQYARAVNIRLGSYPEPGGDDRYGRYLAAGMKRLFRSVSYRLKPRKSSVPAKSGSVPAPKTETAAPRKKGPFSVSLRHSGRKIGFDQKERTEFFWMHSADLSWNDLLLHGVIDGHLLGPDAVRGLRGNGLRAYGRGPGLINWRPTRKIAGEMFGAWRRIVFGSIRALLGGKRFSLPVLLEMMKLGAVYAYWVDFYRANKVGIEVGVRNFKPVHTLALNRVGAISVAYQYSASNIVMVSNLLTAGSDVQLVFSEAFEKLWRGTKGPVGSVVHTGLIDRVSTNGSGPTSDVLDIRGKLSQNGARFIVCFFDENSSDKWFVPFNHEHAAMHYRVLLEWLLEDPSVGVIFKPKHSPTLFKRLAGIAPLIEKAEGTGRCMFLLSGSRIGSLYPGAVAAQSDLAVGLSGGTTAVLEAGLTGTPSVLIDTDGFVNHPFHRWGRGKTIFDSWSELKATAAAWRENPDAVPGFGDWSPGMETFDPFRDGLGDRRLGDVVTWLYTARRGGMAKDEAIDLAVKRFESKWGMEARREETAPGRIEKGIA